jgi:MarR family transcriptional regulator, lower aerobic nicotinate degradation pathway regulator
MPLRMLRRRKNTVHDVICPGNRRLITRRWQVQILPPLLPTRRPRLELEREGVSLYEYSVLAVLGEGVKETQAEIADTLELDRGQLVGVLDGLEEAGLIERRRDQSDRRRHTVSLTPAGKKQLVKMRTIVKRIEDQFLEPLDNKARTALHDALLRVAANHDGRFQQR